MPPPKGSSSPPSSSHPGSTASDGRGPAVLEMKTFVPARDFEESKRFYRAVGFQEDWSNGEIALFKNGDTSFFLRLESDAFYATGLQMHLLVGSVDEWYAHVAPMLQAAGGAAEPPTDRPWGTRDFVLTDPAGVRWRVTQASAR